MTTLDAVEAARSLSESGAHAEALALLDQVRSANDPELHTARGWALENLGAERWVEARRAYEAALALDPGQIWARAGLATVVGRLGDIRRSAQLSDQVIVEATARAPTEPKLLELLGWSQLLRGRTREAVATFRKALAVDAGWVSVGFDLGLALLVLDEPTEALEVYESAIGHLQPDRRRGPLLVAIDDLDDTTDRRPDLRGAQRVRDRLERALARR